MGFRIWNTYHCRIYELEHLQSTYNLISICKHTLYLQEMLLSPPPFPMSQSPSNIPLTHDQERGAYRSQMDTYVTSSGTFNLVGGGSSTTTQGKYRYL